MYSAGLEGAPKELGRWGSWERQGYVGYLEVQRKDTGRYRVLTGRRPLSERPRQEQGQPVDVNGLI